MAYTIRQFINECDNYQYSQEYFDILKESMEIDLMERYIKNQQFITESNIDTSVYTENFFMEADDKSVEDIKKATNKKKVGLLTKILTIIRRLAAKFITSIRKIVNTKSFVADLAPMAAFVKDLTSNPTKEKYDKFLQFVDTYVNIVKSDHTFVPKESLYIKVANTTYRQTMDALNKSNNEYKSDGFSDKISQLLDEKVLGYYVAIAGKTSTPVADISELPDYEGIKICNILTLSDIYKKITKSPEKIDAEKILALLRYETQVCERKGFQMIPSIGFDIEDQQDNIQYNYDELLSDNPDLAEKLSKVNSALNRIYSNILNLYSDFHTIKSELLQASSVLTSTENE